MENMRKGPISSDELMSKLVNAKKVMNKVDSGNYQSGNIDPDRLMSENININTPIDQPTTKPPVDSMPRPINEEKIRNSKLPENIKQAMIDNPIEQISLTDNLNMDFIKGAKRLMEQEGLNKPTQTEQKPQYFSQQRNKTSQLSESELTTLLTPIIENVVRKSIDEILEKKIDQILSVQKTSTINENLVLKVGNNIFSGKITDVKKAKK